MGQRPRLDWPGGISVPARFFIPKSSGSMIELEPKSSCIIVPHEETWKDRIRTVSADTVNAIGIINDTLSKHTRVIEEHSQAIETLLNSHAMVYKQKQRVKKWHQ